MNGWDAEPYFVFYQTQMALLAVERRVTHAEADTEKLRWQRLMLETRIERLQEKVHRRGRVNWRVFMQVKALASRGTI